MRLETAIVRMKSRKMEKMKMKKMKKMGLESGDLVLKAISKTKRKKKQRMNST